MTSAQPYTSTGSKPLVSGDFAVTGFLESFIETYETAIQESLEETISEEQKKFSDTLGRHPDWSTMADGARVRLSEEGLEYTVDGDPDVISHLEYGNPLKKISATGVVRSTARRSQERFPYDFNERVAQRMYR